MAVNIFATKPLCSTKGVNPWLAKMGCYNACRDVCRVNEFIKHVFHCVSMVYAFSF